VEIQTIIISGVFSILSAVVAAILTRKKQNAEVDRINTENKILSDGAKVAKDMAEAELDRYISDTAVSLYENLAKKVKTIEEERENTQACLERERQYYEVNIKRLAKEIELLQKQYSAAVINLEAAKERFSAAVSLARRYRLIAIDLRDQLIDEGIKPRRDFREDDQKLFDDLENE
jgi:hypothetical protein